MNTTKYTEPALFEDQIPQVSTSIRASVIIVSFNSQTHLERCLASIFATENTDLEIIVIDNASTEGGLQEITALCPEIQAISSDRNLGFGGGNNLGAQFAGGEYLVFLNPDTTVSQGWLEELLAPLEADPRVGMTTAQILLMQSPSKINTCGNNIHLSGLTLCRAAGLERQLGNLPVVVSAVSGAAFAMRRELFFSLGGFDEEFFLYVEDSDLSWRARLAGYQCLYVPGSVVFHDYRLNFGPRKTYYQERNRYLMLLKNLRWPSFLLLFPAILLAEFVTWGYVLSQARQQWNQKLQAYAWICCHWKQVLEKRRRAQQQRTLRDREILLQHNFRLSYDQTCPGWLPRLARLVFDPMFYLAYRVVRLAVWW